jgi:hypothetical protein
MEAAGIHVYATLQRNNIKFERNPVDKIVLVSLLMFKNKKKPKKQSNLMNYIRK